MLEKDKKVYLYLTTFIYVSNETYSTRYSENRQSLLDHVLLNCNFNPISLNIIEKSV